MIARFAPKASGEHLTVAERNIILSSVGNASVKRSSKYVPGLTLVKLNENITVEDAIATLKDKSEVLYAYPNYIRKAATTPNDQYFGNQWGLTKISAPTAWDVRTNSDAIVAVIDTGVDYTHEDLVANMWTNPGEIPGNGIDDDNNTYVDDIYGYDFCTFDQPRDSDPMDDSIISHGTMCAGIIGAVGNNGTGITGVCWNVKVMTPKISCVLNSFINSSLQPLINIFPKIKGTV